MKSCPSFVWVGISLSNPLALHFLRTFDLFAQSLPASNLMKQSSKQLKSRGTWAGAEWRRWNSLQNLFGSHPLHWRHSSWPRPEEQQCEQPGHGKDVSGQDPRRGAGEEGVWGQGLGGTGTGSVWQKYSALNCMCVNVVFLCWIVLISKLVLYSPTEAIELIQRIYCH